MQILVVATTINLFKDLDTPPNTERSLARCDHHSKRICLPREDVINPIIYAIKTRHTSKYQVLIGQMRLITLTVNGQINGERKVGI